MTRVDTVNTAIKAEEFLKRNREQLETSTFIALRPNKRATSAISTSNMNVRPQSLESAAMASKSLMKQSQVKETETSMSPVAFLRSHFSKTDMSDKPASHSCFFTKPSEEEMAAYDSDIVNTIRARDIARLRSYHKEGRSLNACNRFGESLLHMACRRGHADVVSFLVDEAGVKINVRDDYGRTPFHDACWTSNPNFDVMDVLLNITDSRMLLTEDVRGHTPFDYARKEHWDSWVQFLMRRGDVLSKPVGTEIVV